MNTDEGLHLVHDFPNPFSPDSALPAINWKGSWIIITPIASNGTTSAPIMAPPRTISPPFLKVEIPEPQISSLPSPDVTSVDTSLPSPEVQSPASIPSPEAENNVPDMTHAPLETILSTNLTSPQKQQQNAITSPPKEIPRTIPSSSGKNNTDTHLPSPITDAQDTMSTNTAESSSPRNERKPKPIFLPQNHARTVLRTQSSPTQQRQQLTSSLTNAQIRMFAPSTRGYTTVSSLGAMPRWREASSSASSASNSSHSSSNGNFNANQNINNASSMNGKRQHHKIDRNQEFSAPTARRQVHAGTEQTSPSNDSRIAQRQNHASSSNGRETNTNSHSNSHSSGRLPPSLSAMSELYNPLEPVVSSSTTTSVQFAPFPRELTDRTELERYVASNAGPPNVGPTTIVRIKREGMRDAPRGELEIEISLSASVSGLKAKIRALTGMTIREQRLTLDKTVLHPDLKMQSLQEELEEGKILTLSKRAGEGRIEVETVDGRIHAFDCGPKDFVADLEDAVLEKIFNNSDRAKFHLLNGGHRLRRPSTLHAAGVKSGHRLRLIFNSY